MLQRLMEPSTHSTGWRWKKKPLLLVTGLAGLLVLFFILSRTTGLTAAVDRVVAGLREAGPAVFFLAMALLPALGFPMFAFTLAAGPVFGPVLGAGWVIVCSLLAVVVNLLLSYWLANRALRPLVSRLLTYFEFRLPESTAGSAWQLALIVRLTPGPPFWVQSYLLGLIRVPLAPYLVVSTLVMAGYIVALVLGGEAFANGDGRLAFGAAGGLVVFVALLQLLRQRSARQRAAAAAILVSPPQPIPANANRP